jgi:5'-nucleotidase
MRILLTNDDGISHPHLKTLQNRLEQEHEVWVMAPAGQQSGCSHGITLVGPITVKQEGKRNFACTGTPADCVLLALKGFLPVKPEEIDLVISGINPGPNLGTDIIYSGTVAGARQAAIMGKPSFAVSINRINVGVPPIFPAEFVARNLKTLHSLWSPGLFLNINFPGRIENGVDVKITFPAQRIYHDTITRFSAPDGKFYCFITGDTPGSVQQKGSDHDAIVKNNISLSFISVHPIHKKDGNSSSTDIFWKGENGQ